MLTFCWNNYPLLKTVFSFKLKYWVTSQSDSLGISLRNTFFFPGPLQKQVLACSVHLFLQQPGWYCDCTLFRLPFWNKYHLRRRWGWQASLALALFSPGQYFPIMPLCHQHLFMSGLINLPDQFLHG